MAPHLSTFLRVYTESSVDDVQPDIRALLYGDTKDLAPDGCIVVRHGPSTANILQERKRNKEFVRDPLLYKPMTLPFFIPPAVVQRMETASKDEKVLEIATSQLKRTKMTAILLAHHANVTHLKAYPFAALNETSKRSDNPLVRLVGSTLRFFRVIGNDNRPSHRCNDVVREFASKLGIQYDEIVPHASQSWYDFSFAVSSGERMRRMLSPKWDACTKLSRIMGNYAVFQSSPEHATSLDIFSIGIPKQVIKDRLKNVDPSELYTMESTCLFLKS